MTASEAAWQSVKRKRVLDNGYNFTNADNIIDGYRELRSPPAAPSGVSLPPHSSALRQDFAAPEQIQQRFPADAASLTRRHDALALACESIKPRNPALRAGDQSGSQQSIVVGSSG